MAACRMLKYSPEHMHCLANIFGALAPPNTGILAVQSTSANQKVRLYSCSCLFFRTEHHFVLPHASKGTVAMAFTAVCWCLMQIESTVGLSASGVHTGYTMIFEPAPLDYWLGCSQ